MKIENLKLSIIIPTYNRADILRQCLEHLAAQKDAPEFEVIVVSDGSTDHTERMMEQLKKTEGADGHPRLLFFKQPHSQQGIARNRGVRAASAEIICFIGDDIFVKPDFVKTHYEAHQKHQAKNIAVLGFTTWHPDVRMTSYMKFLEQGWQFNYPLLKPGFIKHHAPWKFFYTSNISLKKSFFEREWFDQGFRGYGWEDIELAYRLYKNHDLKICYEPKAAAWHYEKFTEADLPEKMRKIGRSAVVFQKKHPELSVIPTGRARLKRIIGSWPIFLPFLKIFWRRGYYHFRSWREFYLGQKQDIKKEKV